MSNRLVDGVRLAGLFHNTDCGIFYHAVLGVRLSHPHSGEREAVIFDCNGNFSYCVITHNGKRIKLLHDGLLRSPRELQDLVRQTAIRQGSSICYTCIPGSTACVVEVFSYYASQKDRDTIEADFAQTLVR